MKLRARIAVLLLLAASALYAGAEAWRSLQPGTSQRMPEELYARFARKEAEAEYYLRACDGFVAVYGGKKGRSPVSVTGIEVSGLRGADRVLLERGIPVADRLELLALLADLGS